MVERGKEGEKKRERKKNNEKKVQTHLVEVVDVALALELPKGLVLLQGTAVELLVGRDDVDPGLFD